VDGLDRQGPLRFVVHPGCGFLNTPADLIWCKSRQTFNLRKTKTSSVSRPVTALEYRPTGISDGMHGELYAAPAYGDLAGGPHGTFIKLPPGFVSPPHTHTEDYCAVVVSGVMVNKKPDSPDVPFPAGSYCFQKGGDPA